MTSQTRIAANRRNALRSTGPRTDAGKMRASHNARKHGLSVNIHYDQGVSNKVEALAVAITGKNATPRRLQAARGVAEAEFELRRFQEFKLSLIEVEAAGLRAIAKIVDDGDCKVDGNERMLQDVALADMRDSSILAKLERYERRALSRHWRALNKYVIAIEEKDV
jgi:hypothetical protein